MTARANARVRFAVKSLAALILTPIATIVLLTAFAVAGDPPALGLDAGVGPTVEIGGGAVVAETHLDGNGPQVAPALVPQPDTIRPADPPASRPDVANTLAEDGRWAALALVLTVGLRRISKKIKTTSALAFLRRGRWPAIIGGVTAVGCAFGDAILAGGTWTAVALAVITAGATYIDGFGADEDKPKDGAVAS